MPAEPLVSVILPTYDRAAMLPTAIESVLAQSHRALELIVVDDASTDATRAIVDAIDDERVRCIHLAGRGGASAARNRGLQESRGEYIAFQDSDDVWRVDKLTIQLRQLEETAPAAAVCVCSYELHKGDKRSLVVHPKRVVSGHDVVRQLLGGASFATPTLLAAKGALLGIGGFDEALPRRQDFELCLRLASKHAFTFVPDVLVETRYSADSISIDPFKFADATKAIRTKHSDLFDKNPYGESVQLYKTGKHLALAGHIRQARPYVRLALKLNPSNWRARILMLNIVTGTVSLAKALKG